MVERKALIGTSGWSYDEWVGPFYPRSLEKGDFLPYYAKVFYTNEINTTFYNVPSKWIVSNWVDHTPSEFVFTAKIPQKITHEGKLNCDVCMDDLSYFLESMSPLIKAKKLLAFLVQLPPSFTKSEHFGNLKEFVENWPGDRERDGYELAIEFRHESWMEDDIFSYLKAQKLSYCGVIEPLLPPRMDVTNPKLAYVRFHGFGKKPWFNYCFTEEEIKKFALSIKQLFQQADKVGVYFNNHFSGYAVKNSLMMMNELNLKPRSDPKAVDVLEVKKKSGTVSKGQMSLDKFVK